MLGLSAQISGETKIQISMFIVEQNMTSKYENQKKSEGYEYIIGCDEVGRGCLAGPVIACAVILPMAGDESKVYKVIKDSKQLSAEKREELAPIIKNIALAWSIGEVSPEVVDEINIHNASLLAMKRAVETLVCHCEGVHPTKAILSLGKIASSPDKALAPRNDRYLLAVDGKFPVPGITHDQEAIIGGDAKVLSIAAASIIAKVYRDGLMQKLHQQYPPYNFAQHKGYATVIHRNAIIKHGLSPIHRLTFCSQF